MKTNVSLLISLTFILLISTISSVIKGSDNFQINYPSSTKKILNLVEANPGGGFILCGNENDSTLPIVNDILMLKINDSGTPLWSKRYSSGFFMNIKSSAITQNGEIIVAGYAHNNPV